MKDRSVNVSKHLSRKDTINLGSFYTPEKYVLMIKDWLKEENIDEKSTIFDPSCGYGAFFEMQEYFSQCKYIGNDIDTKAIETIPQAFDNINLYNLNIFENFTRDKFGIADDEKLIIVAV